MGFRAVPDHRKDLKSRSPNFGPDIARPTQDSFKLDPSGGLG